MQVVTFDSAQWLIQNFWKGMGGGAERNLLAPSSFVAYANNEIYAFYTENGF